MTDETEAGKATESTVARPVADVSSASSWIVLAVVIVAYAAYAAIYIFKTSFVVKGQRFFCLFDDAMISMRYARNWVEGAGLVWNPGETVEGYTNFLWVCVMAVVHLLPLEARFTSLVVQILCVGIGAGLVLGTYHLGRSLRLLRVEAVGGATITAFYFPLVHWNLQGMETGLLAMLLVFGAARCARDWQRGSISIIGGALLGAALLVRPDAMLIVLGTCAFFSLRLRRSWRGPVLTLVVALSMWTAYWLSRWAYYESFWPNTYHLKMGVPVLFRIGVLGASYVAGTIDRLGIVFISALVLTLVGLGRTARWEVFGVFLLSVAGMVWVGGDAWRYERFICPAIPFVALGLSHGVSILAERHARRTATDEAGSISGLKLACCALLVLSMNFAYLQEWITVSPHYAEANHWNVRKAEAILESTTPDARVAVFWGGAIPYFTGRHCIDVLGKSDAFIAREIDPLLRAGVFPGHNKFELRYSLLFLDADVLDTPGGGFWPDLPSEPWFAAEFHEVIAPVDGYAIGLWVRNNSERVRQ